MTQNKLIGFCYLFIIGIAVAMAFPVSADYVHPLWNLTFGLGIVTVLAFAIVRKLFPRKEDDSDFAVTTIQIEKPQIIIWLLLLVTGLTLGYTRYLAMMQSPDIPIGTFAVQNGAGTWNAQAPMDKTSFIKLKTLAPVQEDIRLRVHGKLEALQPVLDDNGNPILDEKVRWKFTQYDLQQQSDEIVIPAGTPARTELLIEQEFSSVDSIELLSAPQNASLGIYRPRNVVELFARTGRNVVPVSLLGRITADPWVYSFKNVLSITPDYIQYRPDGPYLPVEGQTVRVTLDDATDPRNAIPFYDDLARSDAYGYDVALFGELVSPSGAANVGAFDQAKYLRNHNIGGQIKLRVTETQPRPISIITPEGMDAPRDGNGLVEFSLYLRDEIVRVIKQTMPQPNSAFLGALTLGLRYGMQNTVSVASDVHSDGVVAPILDIGEDTDVLIADEFRASGINHVLAVSGLHVTIITIMFMGIFAMLRVSKKVYVPIVILALVMFAIITGARPSTLRAVIMNSLFLLTWGYMDQGLRSSALLGVPVAAFIILLQNPAMAVDPSFTLSFGAILSLALLTQPFFDIFKKFRGNNFVGLIIMLAVLTWAFAAHWFLVCTMRFWVCYTLLGVVLFTLANFLDRIGFNPLKNRGFADIPPGISTFIAAQFGIQIGMMVPLSAYYFYRWPVAGAYANLIAIPLVGVVLQLSMLAGLIGLIPGVGIYIALFLNAANWIFSTGFLLIGHYFAKWFIYPFVTRPTLRWMFVYYALCALFIWWRPIFFRFVRPRWRQSSGAQKTVYAVLAAALVLGLGILNCKDKMAYRHDGELEVTVLSVGYGSAIVVDTPGNEAILIDTAFVQQDRGKRNDAERTIMPYLATHQIGKLDAVILTSPNAEHAAGAYTMLAHFDTTELYYPESVIPVLHEEPLRSLLEERSPENSKHRISGTTIECKPIQKGDRLFEGTYDGKDFYIEVLSPDSSIDRQAPLTLRIVFGDFAMMILSDLTFAQQQALLNATPAEKLNASVTTIPYHGTPGIEKVSIAIPQNYQRELENVTIKLLNAINPETTILEFGNPRPPLGDKSRVAIKLQNATKRAIEDNLLAARHLATDIDGAVEIRTDGRTWAVHSLSDTARTLGTHTDAPTSLEIGGW